MCCGEVMLMSNVASNALIGGAVVATIVSWFTDLSFGQVAAWSTLHGDLL